jgi:hypothetical protein
MSIGLAVAEKGSTCDPISPLARWFEEGCEMLDLKPRKRVKSGSRIGPYPTFNKSGLPLSGRPGVCDTRVSSAPIDGSFGFVAGCVSTEAGDEKVHTGLFPARQPARRAGCAIAGYRNCPSSRRGGLLQRTSQLYAARWRVSHLEVVRGSIRFRGRRCHQVRLPRPATTRRPRSLPPAP